MCVVSSIFLLTYSFAAEEQREPMSQKWGFTGLFGKFDRSSLQRGFQVYSEVCSACHSLNYLAYRNLGEEGGPEFSLEQVKAIAAQFEIEDGPNEDGEMFMRSAVPSDSFVNPWPNEKAGRLANGGAYPPDLSVIIKARKDGANYVYSLLTGYDEVPPSDFELGENVYYNPYMSGQRIAMPKVLEDGLIEYFDGTEATLEQMSYDVTNFLAWAAEPKLEQRKSLGLQVMAYIIILATLLYFINRRLWSKVEK